MAGRRLTPDEETRLIQEAESQRAGVEALPPARRIDKGASPSVVLSVRIPVTEMERLRRLSRTRGLSLSALVQEAIDALLSDSGPRISSSPARTLRIAASGLEPSSTSSSQPAWQLTTV